MLSFIWNFLGWSKAPTQNAKTDTATRGIELQAIPNFKQSMRFFQSGQTQDPAKEWHDLINSYEIVGHPNKYIGIRNELEGIYYNAPRPPTPPPKEEKDPATESVATGSILAEEVSAIAETKPTAPPEQPVPIAPDLSNKLALFRPQEVKIDENILDQRRLLLAQIKKTPLAESAPVGIPTAPPLSSNWNKK